MDIKPFMNWEAKLNKMIDWHRVLKKAKKIGEIKLKWFQLRICFRILVTNKILRQMRIVDNDKCNFCKTETDTVEHYLWDCVHVHSFWSDLVSLMQRKCENCITLTISQEMVLFGTDENCEMDDVFELILLFAKFFVYKCRFNNTRPRLQAFLKELQYKYKTEEHVHCLKMQHNEFHRKWYPYINLIDVF